MLPQFISQQYSNCSIILIEVKDREVYKAKFRLFKTKIVL